MINRTSEAERNPETPQTTLTCTKPKLQHALTPWLRKITNTATKYIWNTKQNQFQGSVKLAERKCSHFHTIDGCKKWFLSLETQKKETMCAGQFRSLGRKEASTILMRFWISRNWNLLLRICIDNVYVTMMTILICRHLTFTGLLLSW